ncbi:hypothetical protein A3C17_00665 [Candidatus Uhrbacteria bacterium RIFCSPHIGHO2_02_FULL_53_13]|uniref:Uncharacterized protein n=2 Tax=Candidatus Uhriibacteriota TaxID=1752732 RepID=A0A1F7TYE2_9BACT|nr:MAG: hypothetical protein A3C17_00665 [Candidatus Uhrbacteria bacterium RIFCSPHIGHO2_02_FULL_53_13]OGL90316.1 MAG: hypothetical protein A3I45_02615 [Candidatus Uhrbacteria bacterium RIFCSPLOWO2_02_FULL_53_10]
MTDRHTVFVGRLPHGRARVRDAFDKWLDDPKNQPPLSAVWPPTGDNGRGPTRLGETLEEMMDSLLLGEPTDPWERRKAGLLPTLKKPAL